MERPVFIRGTVQAAFLRRPLILPTLGKVFVLWLASGLRFSALRQPDIFDAGGTPLVLAAELAGGSDVVVNADDNSNILRAVQVMRQVVANPFATFST
jgi:hypothetical protein